MGNAFITPRVPPLVFPLLVAVYFVVGYPLKIIYAGQVSDRQVLQYAGWYFHHGDSGALDFKIALTAAIFIIGIILGAFLARAGKRKRHAEHLSLPQTRNHRSPGEGRTMALVWAWFIGIVSLRLLMFRYDIGKTGVAAQSLPFRVAGWCVYACLVSFPFLWIYLWSIVPQLHRKKAVAFTLATTSVFYAVLSGFMAMSRSAGISFLQLGAALAVKQWRVLNKTARRFAAVSVVSLFVLFLVAVVPAVSSLRFSDRGRKASLPETLRGVSAVVTRDTQEHSRPPLEWVLGRIAGIEDLTEACAYERASLGRFYQVAFQGGAGGLFLDLFGTTEFMTPSSGRIYSGRGFNVVALLALSGSTLFVFTVATLFSFIVCTAEIYYDRRGLPAFAAAFALLIGLTFTESCGMRQLYIIAAFLATQWALRRFVIPWLSVNTHHSHPGHYAWLVSPAEISCL